jgi:hypothetical protein
MKIMILSPGRTSAVGSRAREWTVQIISWFLNHTRWMHLSTQVSNSYRVPLLRTALDIFWLTLVFLFDSGHGLGFLAQSCYVHPLFCYVSIIYTPLILIFTIFLAYSQKHFCGL